MRRVDFHSSLKRVLSRRVSSPSHLPPAALTDVVVGLEPGLSRHRAEAVVDRLRAYGFDLHRTGGGGRGAVQTVLSPVAPQPGFDRRHVLHVHGGRDAFRVPSPYTFASRSWRAEDTVVDVDGVPVGGPEVVVGAGPCAVESEGQIEESAAAVAAAGARLLRGGAFKPRTSPYSFQGLG